MPGIAQRRTESSLRPGFFVPQRRGRPHGGGALKSDTVNEPSDVRLCAARRSRAEERIPEVTLAPNLTLYLRGGKRVFDLAGAAVGALLLAPVFLAIAVAIKVNSTGPILYRSRRVGEGGRVFSFLKFRSMVRNAEMLRDELDHLNEVDGPVFKIARDPRITRVGALLRRSSLDELPQLWNVWRGDMSLVGPRPPIPEEVLHYQTWQMRRLSVRPGLTCLWQVSGRSRVGFDEWMRMDLAYIDRRSLRLDLSILLRTVPAVLSGIGAY
jgi:lipopolysaccharide/colanic/teichoic acid biosynthesis glycosyltransferase